MATISEYQDQVITGTLLGDASCAVQKHSDNPYIRIGHSLKDLGYTQWKYGALLSSGLLHSGVNKWGAFTTLQNKELWRYRNLFYKDGIKVISPEVLNLVQPLGLAVWFMDDGTLIKGISRSSGPYYVIALSCFSMGEGFLVCDWLKMFYDVEFSLYAQRKAGYDKLYPYIATTRVAEGEKLSALIDEYIPESMKRKRWR